MGFTWTGDAGCPIPLCFMCCKRLTHAAMAPAKLRHFMTNQSERIKVLIILEGSGNLRRNRIQLFCKVGVSGKALEASYLVV